MQGIDIIRLSEKQKQQLIILKRKTGIENWNVLCRWALCMSLADPTVPPKEDIPSDSNVEMTWKTFAGEFSNAYLSLLQLSFANSREQISGICINAFLKIHLNRGLSYMMRYQAI
ncbi:DNA sulfur modification protein DndE [Rheinheimera baltica]|uniref:DNA sulfur modification protein DndE n=1 Tax=Rheinheimera baltica TaxID=67576 RepID=UPI000408B6B9|nr:DNA sulfur modification protein DndE [Rheinheimera baltica]